MKLAVYILILVMDYTLIASANAPESTNDNKRSQRGGRERGWRGAKLIVLRRSN